MSNLEMFRGDTKEWLVLAKRDGIAIDLTGAKVWFTARRGGAGGSIAFARTSDLGDGITIDPDQVVNRGKATVKLRVDDTAALPPERTALFYDIQVKQGTDVWTLVAGTLYVNPDATVVTT